MFEWIKGEVTMPKMMKIAYETSNPYTNPITLLTLSVAEAEIVKGRINTNRPYFVFDIDTGKRKFKGYIKGDFKERKVCYDIDVFAAFRGKRKISGVLCRW